MERTYKKPDIRDNDYLKRLKSAAGMAFNCEFHITN